MNTINKYVSENKPLSYTQILIIIAVVLENIGLALPFYAREGFLPTNNAVANSYTVQGKWAIIILLTSFAILYFLLSRNDLFLLISSAINLTYTRRFFRVFIDTRWMLFSFLESLAIGARYLQISNILLIIGIISYAILKYVLKNDFKTRTLVRKGYIKEKVRKIIDDFKNSSREKRATYILTLIIIISVFMVFKANKLMGNNVKVPAFGVSIIGAYLTVIFGIYMLDSLLNSKYNKVKLAVIIEIVIKMLFFNRSQVLEHNLSTGRWSTISLSVGYYLYTIAIIGCAIVLVLYLTKQKSSNQ